MTQPERILSASPLCVYMWMGLGVGRRFVCQFWAQESDSRYSRWLILACSLAWLLWHKVPSLLHFILTVSHHLTATLPHPDQRSWSLTCPGPVTHERESINHYHFSSSFYKTLSLSSMSSWHLSCLSRVRAFPTVCLIFITLSCICQRWVWQGSMPMVRKGVCAKEIDPKIALEILMLRARVLQWWQPLVVQCGAVFT